jgi:hypothetical protein
MVQKIAAFGNSTQLKNYQCSFNHASIDGTVTLKLEAFDRDGSNSFSKQITLKNNQESPEISLYPNPFSKELYVQYFGSNQNTFAEFFIYDETGKIAQQNLIHLTDTEKQILNTSELSPGLYLIKVVKDEQTYFYRQVKF